MYDSTGPRTIMPSAKALAAVKAQKTSSSSLLEGAFDEKLSHDAFAAAREDWIGPLLTPQSFCKTTYSDCVCVCVCITLNLMYDDTIPYHTISYHTTVLLYSIL